MATYTDKQKRYWEQWPAKRINKWQYILTHGVLYWSAPVLILTFLMDKRTHSWQWELREVLIKLGVWFVAGLVWGYFAYRARNKGYQYYLGQMEAERNLNNQLDDGSVL